MNLYFRLLIIFFSSQKKSKIIFGDTITINLRVLPNDIDLNGHMNNGRYMTILDLALMEYMIRAGFINLALKNSWRPMLGGSIISFKKGLKPFCKYELKFSVSCWDERWTYLQFEFIEKNTVMASGYTKGRIVSKNGAISSKELCQSLGVSDRSKSIPEKVSAWIKADSLLN